MQSFELKPFSPSGLDLILRVRVDLAQPQWTLIYRVSGQDLAKLKTPHRTRTPTRQNELWKTTCFEAFIQPAGSSGYYELNFSSSGHWNIYEFDSYRQGMRELNCAAPQIDWAASQEEAILSVSLPAFISPPFHLGLTAVIESASPTVISYWALTHPGTKPDFHDSKGWTAQCP